MEMSLPAISLAIFLLLASVCDASYYREKKNKYVDEKYHNRGSYYFNKYYGYAYKFKRSPPPPPPPMRKKPSPKPSPWPSTPSIPAPPQSSLAAQFMMPQNDARARLGLRPLIWDSKLQAFAEDWANQRARYGNCYLQHSNGPYGENIFWGGGKAWSPAEAANAWIEERNWYNYGSNSCQSGQQCGHYTQIVWRDSERIGCARVTCSSGDVFMTCNYDPPGNYIGEKPY